jgi:ribosomal protein L37AE/L43A
MTTANRKMLCKDCGMEMNHHADKLVEPISTAEVRRTDKALGGLIEEMHECPSCGKADSRRVT